MTPDRGGFLGLGILPDVNVLTTDPDLTDVSTPDLEEALRRLTQQSAWLKDLDEAINTSFHALKEVPGDSPEGVKEWDDTLLTYLDRLARDRNRLSRDRDKVRTLSTEVGAELRSRGEAETVRRIRDEFL